jgi:hypothetical protein
MKPTILAMIAAGFLLNPHCYAQEGAEQSQDDVNRWWITLGLGWATGAPKFDPQLFGDFSNFGFSESFSYQFGPHVISLRAAGDYNYTGGFLLFFGTGETSSISDIALLYGRSDKGRASMAVGVGFVERKSHQKYILGQPTLQPEKQTTVGLALEGQLYLPIAGWFGLGLYGFGNINSKASFFGVSVAIRLGNLD